MPIRLFKGAPGPLGPFGKGKGKWGPPRFGRRPPFAGGGVPLMEGFPPGSPWGGPDPEWLGPPGPWEGEPWEVPPGLLGTVPWGGPGWDDDF